MELEWIADGEVDGKGILELGDIVVGGFACVVGIMDAHTEVETEDEEVEVVAESETCADGERLEETALTELAMWVHIVAMHEPDVARIEEESTLESIDDGETILGIEFEFHVTSLVKIGASSFGVIVTSRTDASQGEGTNTVGSTHIEEFAVRCPI